MARATTSRWRLESQRVIGEVLARLAREEPDAGLKRKQQALRDAYPFGQRQYLPYSHWCREVRAALDEPSRKRPPPQVRVELGSECLVIRCGWCTGEFGPPGCMACFEARGEARAANELPDLPPWVQALDGGEAGAGLVFADWLEERGYVALAGCLRRQGKGG